MLKHPNQTSFKKGHIPHNKGKSGTKIQNFKLGLPNYCKIHGLHNDWVYHAPSHSCRCRFCRNENAVLHQNKPENKLKNILKHAKSHAKVKNREFSLTLKDLEELLNKQNNKCAISKISFEHGHEFNSISIDRIDSKKGYTLENIQFVTKMVNIMKSNYTQENFIRICKIISKNN